MAKSNLKLVTPAIVKRTVMPRRPANADLRTREHLTEAEVERLMDAARKNRWGHWDATMVLVAYRHGFRPAELVDLRWDQIDFASGALHVRRVKRAHQALTRSLGMSYEPCGAFSVSNSRSRHSCSRRSEEHPSAPQGSHAWLGGLALKHVWGSRLIHICSGTPAATHWPTKGMTPEPCRLISAIATFSIRFAT